MNQTQGIGNGDDVAERYKSRLGAILCALYALVYAGFVIVSVYDVTLMDKVMPFQVNLAIFYGLGLIVFALLLALLYSKSCNACERDADAAQSRATEKETD